MYQENGKVVKVFEVESEAGLKIEIYLYRANETALIRCVLSPSISAICAARVDAARGSM